MAKEPNFEGHPLFDTAGRMLYCDRQLLSHPSLRAFLETMPDGALDDWDVARQFMVSYASTAGTYSRFRGELQRFLLFMWIRRERTLPHCESNDIDLYMRFLRKPPASWCGGKGCQAFVDSEGVRIRSENWRPFTSTNAVQQETINAASRALTAFFRSLVDRGYMNRSPMAGARKREQKAERKGRPTSEKAPRFTDWQWSYIHQHLEARADEGGKWERALFAVITMKALYLRVSELSAPAQTTDPGYEDIHDPAADPTEDDNPENDDAHHPTMGDFQKRTIDGQRFWSLYVYGKGQKERWIPVPEGYLPYLKRYREYRGLSAFPSPGEATPLVSHLKEEKPLGKRQIEHIVSDALKDVAEAMKEDGYATDGAELEQNAETTHMLRHTGASMDIEAGRPLRHVSEDLGHASVAITEQIYVNADANARYHSGFARAI